jgi:hypothetical protein
MVISPRAFGLRPINLRRDLWLRDFGEILGHALAFCKVVL